MSEASQPSPTWPPKKEDLERLYLVEKLSAAKIAETYGLTSKYKTPKAAESTILYYLRRSGIARRDPAEHIRKVTPQMTNDWVARYLTGESLKQIAGDVVSPVTVWNQLKARRVVLRDKAEAQIRAVTKYERKPFSGDRFERAYLVGLRYGDLDAVRHGRAIRVRVSTTHPAMADLFESVFSPYGYVHRYPREARLTGYEWTLECDLDDSFGFLIDKASIPELTSMTDDLFVAFLAGVFDAEGSVLMHKKGNRHDPEVSISNSDKNFLDLLFVRIRKIGLSAHFEWRRQKFDRQGIASDGMKGNVRIWQFADVQRFLALVRFRHNEKLAKAELAKALVGKVGYESQRGVMYRWAMLNQQIHHERRTFLEEAASRVVASRARRQPQTLKET